MVDISESFIAILLLYQNNQKYDKMCYFMNMTFMNRFFKKDSFKSISWDSC